MKTSKQEQQKSVTMRQTNISKHALDAMCEVSKDFGITHGTLRRVVDSQDCLCLIGLACEAYRRETGLGEWLEDTYDPDRVTFVFKAHQGQPISGDACQPEVSKWATGLIAAMKVNRKTAWFYHDQAGHESWTKELAELLPAKEVERDRE